ncbi:unnamed protein product, partial [Staurois parvus]
VIGHSRSHACIADRVGKICQGIVTISLCIHRLNFGDVRHGCSCLAMATHFMKLSTHCCCANLKATRSLEVFSY